MDIQTVSQRCFPSPGLILMIRTSRECRLTAQTQVGQGQINVDVKYEMAVMVDYVVAVFEEKF